jgi:tRNA(Ile)-lysidine synthase
MALTQLLLDLRRRHGWSLRLWHGDHRWHPRSGTIASELAGWATARGLPITVETAGEPPPGEAAARAWRYRCLADRAAAWGCSHVVTAHTGSDRAETLLLNLARGSHLRGLATPRSIRPLRRTDGPGGAWLVRPLLEISRSETAAFCRRRGLPVWSDPGNEDPRPGRNRIRQRVLPELEALHPGASERIGRVGEAIAHLQVPQEELLPLALAQLQRPDAPGEPPALCREGLRHLSAPTAGALLHHWIRERTGSAPGRRQMDTLICRLLRDGAAGKLALAGAWSLHWDRTSVRLVPHRTGSPGAGHPSR